ncbi:hypothetical protein BVC80_379g85 [Macleaya cordata]|uniref:Coenzyme Q-binding protein COQ10 START domain-containing protein n=1 Tax=Macleaya cordata TaxID=56857 RepID=A0A200QSY9_MACCD|nr:hypothetical protein BVC80_379g85 [Macleaya cordata]
MSSSATTTAFLSSPTSLAHFKRIRNGILLNAIPISTSRISSRQSLNQLFFRNNNNNNISHGGKRNSSFTSIRPFSPVMEWQDCTVKTEVDVPCSVAYNCYSDREAIPRWMPFISSVKIVEDKPDLSRWSLKYKAFGQDIEFSWLARNMQPIPNQKIHWRSLEGLPNRK